jgi:peptidoglycan/xylan/chitin deacetylase (PgdA/CDA1 family)
MSGPSVADDDVTGGERTDPTARTPGRIARLRRRAEYRGYAVRRLVDGLGRRASVSGGDGDGPVVLLFHEIDDREARSYGNGTAPDAFRRLLARLEATHDVIVASEFCERLREGTLAPDHAAITFDDGVRSVREHAYPILREVGVPATVFLTTGSLADRRPFWPYAFDFFTRSEYADAFVSICRTVLDRPNLDREAVFDYANFVASRAEIERIVDRAFAELVSFEAYARREGIDGRLFLDADEVREMTDVVEFGAHTVTHPRLAKLPTDALREEIAVSLETVEGLVPEQSRHPFAVPFGGLGTAYGPRTVRIAREAGVRGLFAAYGGTTPPDQPPWAIRRVPVSDRRIGGDLDRFLDELGTDGPGLADRLTERLYERRLGRDAG